MRMPVTPNEPTQNHKTLKIDVPGVVGCERMVHEGDSLLKYFWNIFDNNILLCFMMFY